MKWLFIVLFGSSGSSLFAMCAVLISSVEVCLEHRIPWVLYPNSFCHSHSCIDSLSITLQIFYFKGLLKYDNSDFLKKKEKQLKKETLQQIKLQSEHVLRAAEVLSRSSKYFS